MTIIQDSTFHISMLLTKQDDFCKLITCIIITWHAEIIAFAKKHFESLLNTKIASLLQDTILIMGPVLHISSCLQNAPESGDPISISLVWPHADWPLPWVFPDDDKWIRSSLCQAPTPCTQVLDPGTVSLWWTWDHTHTTLWEPQIRMRHWLSKYRFCHEKLAVNLRAAHATTARTLPLNAAKTSAG